MGAVAKKHPSYGDTEIELALITVANLNGNASKASRELKAAGLVIDRRTLWRWSTKQHVDRYEQIRSEVLPKIRERAAEEHMSLAEAQMEVTRDLTARLKATAKDIPARDLPGAVRNLSTSAAIETDKAQLLGGQPTHRIEKSATDVLRALKARGFDFDGDVAGEEDVQDTEPEAIRG